jgi:hypothetical protein
MKPALRIFCSDVGINLLVFICLVPHFPLCGTVAVPFFFFLEAGTLNLYRYLIFYIGTLIFLESGTSFCIGTLTHNCKSGPAFNFPDPSGGSVIYESCTGRIILILSFLAGTDPTFLIRIRGLNFFIADRLFLLVPSQQIY